MAHDELLAHRVRDLLAHETSLGERRMFGGLAFLVGGHMALAVSRQGGVMVRIDPADAEELTSRPDVRRMVMKDREMNGWLLVGEDVVETDEGLREWVERGVAFVRTLPPK